MRLGLTTALCVCLAAAAAAARNDVLEPALFAPEAAWPAGSDASPAFTPDGRTMFFTHAVGPERTIMVSHRDAGRWSTPVAAPFSGTWRDIEPTMAPDGSYLMFISNRPATPGGAALDGFFGGQARPGQGGNVWRVDRRGSGWGEPVRLPDVVNGNTAIYSPAVAGDGSLYFNHPDPVTRKSHIYRAQATPQGFEAPQPLSISHGEVADFDAAVAADESFIIYSSSRAPAKDDPVLFVSFRLANREWSAPKPLTPVTAGLEARLSPDQKTLYFSAADATGVQSRIFQMPLNLVR